MTTKTKKRVVRSLIALVGAIVVFVGVVGFAHTRSGRASSRCSSWGATLAGRRNR